VHNSAGVKQKSVLDGGEGVAAAKIPLSTGTPMGSRWDTRFTNGNY
jgi:hypothetical protein